MSQTLAVAFYLSFTWKCIKYHFARQLFIGYPPEDAQESYSGKKDGSNLHSKKGLNK